MCEKILHLCEEESIVSTIRHRVVLVGCGDMANSWVKYAVERGDVELAGLVDLYFESAQAFKERYALNCPVFTSLEEALRVTKVSLVFNTTTPSSHHQVATTAMELGCDVLSEKPLATTPKECLDIVKVSERTGRTTAVMQNHRYTPSIVAFSQLIASGVIGKPGYAGVDFHQGPHFGGFRAMMDNPLLLDMSIHTFDQARKILGADPVSVYCHEFNPPGSWFKGNASAICVFEMSGGAVFCYRGSWCTEGGSTSWEGDWRVTGEKGTAIWNGIHPPYAEVVEETIDGIKHVRVDPELPTFVQTHHYGCLDALFEALEQRRPAETDCRTNIYSMMMVLGAIESARTGRKVNIQELMYDQ